MSRLHAHHLLNEGTPMCVFIVRLKQPGLFGGSIRHRPPDTSAA